MVSLQEWIRRDAGLVLEQNKDPDWESGTIFGSGTGN
jgi:hypothetical protein